MSETSTHPANVERAPGAGRGRLPDFIIVGAMRAGTTTLHRYLGSHPEIGMSREKETDYFLKAPDRTRTPSWYSSQFDPQKRFNGEASPNYSKRDMFPGVPERIHAAVPDAKILYIVRDPVERALSQLKFVQRQRPDRTFEDKFDDIVRPSLYRYQLDAYEAHFSDVLVLDFDELKRDPQATLGRISGFLGTDAGWGKVEEININSGTELAALPGWAVRMRRSPLVAAVRTRLPRRSVDLARRTLAARKKAPAPLPPVTDEMRKKIADAVHEDAAAFRAHTGMPFATWSV